jgi:hypothetical protein
MQVEDFEERTLHLQQEGNFITLFCNIFTHAKCDWLFIFNYALQPFKAYCAIWVRRSNFCHQASQRVSPHESTQRRKLELWTRNVREFWLNADFHVILRDLLHAVKLRHGTDGFTFPPKEGVLRIFFALKIRRLRPGANLGTNGQHATSWLQKPLSVTDTTLRLLHCTWISNQTVCTNYSVYCVPSWNSISLSLDTFRSLSGCFLKNRIYS